MIDKIIKTEKYVENEFKRHLDEDIENIFFNLEEFGEIHIVNGAAMSILIDNDRLTQLQTLRSSDVDGIYKCQKLFYVNKKEFGKPPEIESILKLDDDQYRVYDVKNNMGVYEIILEYLNS